MQRNRENNRMGKTRDLFKKIRDTKGTFHAKMGLIKDRNVMHLTEAVEKAMATHSSTLAWKIPWMEEPGRLQSMRWLRVGHDWMTSLSLFTFLHWRRKWQPTPVFLPGESQGRWGLVGYSPWGRKESDMTERLPFTFTFTFLLGPYHFCPLLSSSLHEMFSWYL